MIDEVTAQGRRKLPVRRRGFTLDIEFPRWTGRRIPLTIGLYDDWSIGEVFIGAHKQAGSDGDRAARDVAVLISLGLQWGVPLQVMSDATIKTEAGEPDGLAGIVLDELIKLQREFLKT